MGRQPTGTVTVLFTDVEGSTALWERCPEAMQAALARHEELMRDAIAAHSGHVVKTIGDGFLAAFDTAADALAAVLAAQRALQAEPWGEAVIRVRMGLHSGSAEERDGDYYGPALNRAARLMSAGHGGQILLSGATRELVRDQLPAGVELRDLGGCRLRGLARAEQIFQATAPDLPADFPPLRTLEARPNNLPAQATPFVGRETEIAEIKDLLREPGCRLLTLVGPGGSGKTRLALEVAADILSDDISSQDQPDCYPNGIFFVSLAGLDSVEALLPTVAKALGFSFYAGGEPRQQLLDYLRRKSLLLIMDNFEHLLEGVDLVTDVLKSAPGVDMLATSRTRLNVQGEHLFPVLGMHLPPAESIQDADQYSAVKLFLQSARRANPAFEVKGDELKDVAQICHVVQGMPLGILLAASWVAMLSPAETLTEIQQSLDFLETDARDVPERQRSMRAVFDHSWKLLTGREREVFQALSVFRGGFARHAAQEVAGASLRELMGLVNKSLLHRTAKARYELHELLRQYAAEKLVLSPDADAVRDQHSAYYTAALQRWAAELQGPRQVDALVELDVEIENARAAWDWAVDQGLVEWLDRALEGLCLFYERRSRYEEGEAACRTAAERLKATASGDELRVVASMLTWQAAFLHILGDTEVASRLLRQSMTLLDMSELDDHGARWGKAHALCELADLEADSDREEGKRLWVQSLGLFQTLGDQWWTARTLQRLGYAAWQLGAYGEARRLHTESLEIRQALGDQRGIGRSLQLLSYVPMYRWEFEEAERLLGESLRLYQEAGDPADLAEGLTDLGCTLSFRGDHARACTLYEESVAIYNHLGFSRRLPLSSILLALAEVHLGRYEGARALAQTALTVSRDAGNQEVSGLALFVLGNVALAGEAHAEAQGLLQEGTTIFQGIGQQHELALASATLGYADRALGQLSQARGHLSEALRIASGMGVFRPLMLALPGVALLLADQGEVERAAELYALASRYPFVGNSRWFQDVAGNQIDAVVATLSPEAGAAAQERGRTRDLEATVAELLAELGSGEG